MFQVNHLIDGQRLTIRVERIDQVLQHSAVHRAGHNHHLIGPFIRIHPDVSFEESAKRAINALTQLLLHVQSSHVIELTDDHLMIRRRVQLTQQPFHPLQVHQRICHHAPILGFQGLHVACSLRQQITHKRHCLLHFQEAELENFGINTLAGSKPQQASLKNIGGFETHHIGGQYPDERIAHLRHRDTIEVQQRFDRHDRLRLFHRPLTVKRNRSPRQSLRRKHPLPGQLTQKHQDLIHRFPHEKKPADRLRRGLRSLVIHQHRHEGWRSPCLSRRRTLRSIKSPHTWKRKKEKQR
ncbi:MAG: hypothetical protein BWY82_02441 [Verrucomicrobia bacterium ADurb.Bin474]|nr:MAG: hypothetical protein BWY82_02441 [Verrucomicrobia bacterium ADurb.Bin474]